MTIKDMETHTGMSRANIRYYEAEGLLCPQRGENGYRIYSREDAAILLKIKLLRCLGLSLEQIRSLQSGNLRLESVLTSHLTELDRQQELLSHNQQVTRLLIDDGVSYATLDPTHYLHILESGEQILKTDVQKKPNLPWRRYWARCFDFYLYSTILKTLLPIDDSPSFSLLTGLLAMLLTEPLLLHFFGTTPGKLVLGIRVMDPEGGKLRFADALERTWLVLWEGEGLRIPLVTLYFHYKSFTAAQEEKILPWEKDSELTIQDGKIWRYGVYIAAVAALIALDITWMLTGG